MSDFNLPLFVAATLIPVIVQAYPEPIPCVLNITESETTRNYSLVCQERIINYPTILTNLVNVDGWNRIQCEGEGGFEYEYQEQNPNTFVWGTSIMGFFDVNCQSPIVTYPFNIRIRIRGQEEWTEIAR